MKKSLIARLRGVERVNILTANGLQQELVCDCVIISRLEDESTTLLQFMDLYGGDHQRLKEKPRIVGTMRINALCTLEDDIVTGGFHLVSQDGLIIRIKPEIGGNLRLDQPPTSTEARVLVRRLVEMHNALTELERQRDLISSPEARTALEASLLDLRARTSSIERRISGTIIATEGPAKGRGIQ